jgi:hypothetical protein
MRYRLTTQHTARYRYTAVALSLLAASGCNDSSKGRTSKPANALDSGWCDRRGSNAGAGGTIAEI